MKSPVKLLTLFLLLSASLKAQRVPVLNQVDLPHNYYYRELYIPQLTSGPSSVAWSADGHALFFSMGGSLWMQNITSETAEQLTDGNGYDYQPDCSPDGKQIVFVRYNGVAIELMLLDIESKEVYSLTNNNGVNLEPRWSPDGNRIAFISTAGTGHFLLYTVAIEKNKISDERCLTPDRKSLVKRYYYSAFDHAINPVWSPDGKEIYCISNREIIHGTGDLVAIHPGTGEPPRVILHEETSWKTKPDISPDGSRLVYSSYLGRNWHQLWMIPAAGGYPMPLTYGEYDNTSPRWSPDGKKIAFISNRNGNTSLWWLNVFDGAQQQVIASHLQYLMPHKLLKIKVVDENRKEVPARVSITDRHGKFYAPSDAWIQADDSRYVTQQQYESHYFHSNGTFEVNVPEDQVSIQVSHGPLYEIDKMTVDTRLTLPDTIIIQLKKLELPSGFGNWWSGDVHVHMNYGGNYRNTPANLVHQAKAEDVNVVYNLIVNKEQRIPDVAYFSPDPDKSSDDKVLLLHGQEFHTSYWGHLGLLDLDDHLIIPDYSGYPQTAVASLFPHNTFIAKSAHQQNALVGYVHPFEQSEIFPEQSSTLTNELPVDAALGNVDYYELIGFSDHKASAAVWYQLLNCGIKIPAAAGTDAMANYASLRGPVGLNRVYVKAEGSLNQEKFQEAMKLGKSFVTNGPIIGFTVENAATGDSIIIDAKGKRLSYSGFLRSAVPVNYVEIVWNGKVVASYKTSGSKKTLDVKGTLNVKGPGWLLLRAWSEEAHPDLPDIYPYASTNPVYIHVAGKPIWSKSGGEYFLKWLDRLEKAVNANTTYRNDEEKNTIVSDIHEARKLFTECVQHFTVE